MYHYQNLIQWDILIILEELMALFKFQRGDNLILLQKEDLHFDELDDKNINYPELFIGANGNNFGVYYGMKYKSFKEMQL